jgi:hypothetical protein
MIDAIELFKSGDYKKARTLICDKARPEEYDEIFKFCYRNLGLWSDDAMKQDQAVVIIRNGLAKAALVADPEINLMATFVELSWLRD